MALKSRSYILDLDHVKLSCGIFFILSCLMERYVHLHCCQKYSPKRPIASSLLIFHFSGGQVLCLKSKAGRAEIWQNNAQVIGLISPVSKSSLEFHSACKTAQRHTQRQKTKCFQHSHEFLSERLETSYFFTFWKISSVNCI